MEEGEGGLGSGQAPDLEPGDTADGLGPPKGLLDPFADAQAGGIAIMAGRSSVDQRFARLAQLPDGAIDGDVRGDLALAQGGDEARGIEQPPAKVTRLPGVRVRS